MRLTRVFVETPLAAGMRLTIDGGAANHVMRVLRLRARETVTLFDGRSGEYSAVITEIHRDEVSVEVGEHRNVEVESSFDITLAQGVSRGERMDWVIQKATELGVARITPLLTERSVVQLDEKQAARKVQHWRSIAVAACEQSGRNRVPPIDVPGALPDYLQVGKVAGSGYLLSPGADLALGEASATATSATILIGPEGGLTEFEQEAAIRIGFTAVRMGPRVLRTETAAVAAMALLQQKFGDL